MEEKELKTSLKQRIFIIVIAVIMLGSIVASYAAIVLAGGSDSSSSSTSSTISDEKVAEYEAEYEEKLTEFAAASMTDFNEFVQYKSEVKAYNETAANEGGVQTRDLKVGDGRELTDGDLDYLAYYVGWCADETVFDTSFDDASNPTSFKGALSASSGLIEGWNTGVVGMKMGGVREITVPGELAYGSSREMCGGYNKPLKFLVMVVENEEELATKASEVELAYLKVQYAYMGYDYDSLGE